MFFAPSLALFGNFFFGILKTALLALIKFLILIFYNLIYYFIGVLIA